MKLLRKIYDFFFRSTLGLWCFALLFFLAISVSYLCWQYTSLKDLAKDFEPLAVIVIGLVSIFIGLVSIFIASSFYLQTKGSKFVVNYAVSSHGDSPEWGQAAKKRSHYGFRNIAASNMPFVSRIYVRNEKNKVEAIEKISLQIHNKIIIPLISYENKEPLLIKPFDHVTKDLDPVTSYYVKKDDETENDDVEKFYVIDRIDGKDVLYDRKNRIIIQTQDRVSSIEANTNLKKTNSENSITLTANTLRDTYGTILSYYAEGIYLIYLAERPLDEEIFQSWFSPEDKHNILNQTQKFGIQLATSIKSDWYDIRYCFLTKDNKKFFFGNHPSWKKDFDQNYEICLKTQDKVHSFKFLCPFLDQYLTAIKIKTDGARVELNLDESDSPPPHTLQELLIEKKPSLKSRLGKFFFWKAEKKRLGAKLRALLGQFHKKYLY